MFNFKLPFRGFQKESDQVMSGMGVRSLEAEHRARIIASEMLKDGMVTEDECKKRAIEEQNPYLSWTMIWLIARKL